MGELFRLERASQPLEFTGERLTSSATGQIEIDHLHRYFIAREICRNKNVLDVASGEGYGSALLAQVAKYVVGVEIDAKSVAHANYSYSRQNLGFIQGDARSVPLLDASFDVVVSFETLEHFAEHEDFLREVRRVLRPSGILLVSTPDRDVYSHTGLPANPYHVRELTRDEFRSALGETFPHVSIYGQRAFTGSVLLPKSQNLSSGTARIFERRGPNYAEADLELPRAPILVALASDQPLSNLFSASLYITESQTEVGCDTAYDRQAENGCVQKTVPVQVYPFGTLGYSEDTSIQQRISCEAWETASFELPDGLGRGPLRIDPADRPCVLQIGRIIVRSTQTGNVLWRAESAADLYQLDISGSCALLPNPNACFIVSYGSDPQIKLPTIETPIRPLRVELLLHVSTNPAYVYKSIALHTRVIHDKIVQYDSELKSSHNERMLITTELKRVATERNEARRELASALEAIQSGHARENEIAKARQRLESELDALKSRLEGTIAAQQTFQESLEKLRAENCSLGRQLAAERQIRAALERSVSWRVTEPARTVMGLLRRLLRH